MRPLDGPAVERACGWRVHVHERLGSTSDEAARLRDGGAPPRTAVVARAQTAGRGRAGRAFVSPAGGLYASLLVGARPEDLPGPLVAASALAAAEALEQVAGVRVALKWPNDLWIGRKKVGGLLLEAGGAGTVVVGLGVNVERVPAALAPEVAAATTALEAQGRAPVEATALLTALLRAVDARLGDLHGPSARAALAEAWRERLALRGERVTWVEGGRARSGRLLDVALDGLSVEEDGVGPRRLRAEHVQELRPAAGGAP